MTWAYILTDVGFLVALALYWGVGTLFRVPMALNLAVDLFVSYSGMLGDNSATIIFVSVYNVLFLFWVILLSGLQRGRVGALLSYTLVLTASGIGIYTTMRIDFAQPGAWIHLGTVFFYIASGCIFVIILGVFAGSLMTRIQKGYWNLLMTPKRRVLIPIGIWSAIISASELYGPFVPDWLHQIRFLIAAFCLAWGWVVLEFPHYIEYLHTIKRD